MLFIPRDPCYYLYTIIIIIYYIIMRLYDIHCARGPIDWLRDPICTQYHTPDTRYFTGRLAE